MTRVTPPGELLDACRALAHDTLGCEPATLREYKRLIDAGFAGTYGEGLTLEARSSGAHARGVTAEAIAERRQAVQSRGRTQAGG